MTTSSTQIERPNTLDDTGQQDTPGRAIAALTAPHAHRWRIAEPNGPASAGICRMCGASGLFKNWLSESDFLTNEEHRSGADAA
jgi:hypothetical protein